MRVRLCTLAIGRHDGIGADVNARFVTEDGVVVPAVTAERMREIDRIAMEETGPNLFHYTDPFGACGRVRLSLSPAPLEHQAAEHL